MNHQAYAWRGKERQRQTAYDENDAESKARPNRGLFTPLQLYIAQAP